MGLFRNLLQDELGSVLSAEAVVVGTLVLVGASAGLKSATNSIDSELYELAASIRHLDQSYSVERVEIDGDWSAGSAYTQPDLQKSLDELEQSYESDRSAVKERAEKARETVEQRQEPAKPQRPRRKRIRQLPNPPENQN